MELDAGVPKALADTSKGECERSGLLLSTAALTRIDSFVLSPGRLSPRRFEFDPQWCLTQLYLQREAGRAIVGYFHTHPKEATLEPSLADREGHPPYSLVLIVGGGAWKLYRTRLSGERWTLLSEGT